MRVFVFDLGGGTFDVSVLEIEDGVIEVLATRGDSNLGGTDIDDVLVKHCVKDFEKIHKLDISTNTRALCRLRNQCIKAKEALSFAQEALIECDSLASGLDYSFMLTRARFEQVCSHIFSRVTAPMTAVLSDAHLTKNQIDEVIMVGGSTRIPKVQAIVTEFFEGKSLNKRLNPDEAVAFGATIQAGILSGHANQELNDIILLDVAPLSLGIATTDETCTENNMTTIIKRNTSIPIEFT